MPLRGSRDNFPGKSTARHLSRELSLLSFFAHIQRRRLLPPSALPRQRRKEESGVESREIDIGRSFRFFFSFSFFFFSFPFFLRQRSVERTNYLSESLIFWRNEMKRRLGPDIFRFYPLFFSF